MAKFLVRNSGPLIGEVTISGSKNAVLPIMAASLLTNEKCQIMDVPRLRDVDVMCSILSRVGAEVEEDYGNNQLYIEAGDILENEAPYALVNKMRASVLLMGPLLARTGRAKMPLPGGCAIGARPIDLHLKGFAALGAKIEETSDYVEAIAENGLKG